MFESDFFYAYHALNINSYVNSRTSGKIDRRPLHKFLHSCSVTGVSVDNDTFTYHNLTVFVTGSLIELVVRISVGPYTILYFKNYGIIIFSYTSRVSL